MWVAFAAATGLIAYFVGRVSEALAQRERELTEARAAAAKSERLAALFALGAGAAHELRHAAQHDPHGGGRAGAGDGASGPAAAGGRDYIALIRGEVDRCTQVLDQLSGRASRDIGRRLAASS